MRSVWARPGHWATGWGWGGRYSALAYTDRLRLTVTTQTVINLGLKLGQVTHPSNKINSERHSLISDDYVVIIGARARDD